MAHFFRRWRSLAALFLLFVWGGNSVGVASANVAPTPGGFGSHLVTGIEVALDGHVLGGNTTFLSESTLCSPEVAGPLTEWLRGELLAKLNPIIRKYSPFPIRGDAQLRLNCKFRAEVVRACQDHIVLRLVMPRSTFRFWLDVKEPIDTEAIGADADPGLQIAIDLAATTRIVIPANRDGALAVGTTTLSLSNLNFDGTNPAGRALKWLARAANDVQMFFGGRDFLAFLEQNYRLKFPGVSKALTDLHPIIKRVPPAYRIQSCLRGDSTVVRLGAGTPEPVAAGMENLTDRPGFDLDRFDIETPQACQLRCLNRREECRAWTYVRPGIQGENARCYLKSDVPRPRQDLCCVSGVLPSRTGPDAMRQRDPIASPRSPDRGDVTQAPDDIAGAVPGPQNGSSAPYGAIGDKYAKLGGFRSPLGQPTSREADAPHGGRCQALQHGTICWHPQIGEAFVVWGAIHDKWLQLGRTEFGYPITDERTTPDGRGRYNHFRFKQYTGDPESSIYWTSQTGAQSIHGAIRDAWAQQGWERGPLGYPTSDEHQDGKYRRTNFERGYIRWAGDTGIEIGR